VVLQFWREGGAAGGAAINKIRVLCSVAPRAPPGRVAWTGTARALGDGVGVKEYLSHHLILAVPKAFNLLPEASKTNNSPLILQIIITMGELLCGAALRSSSVLRPGAVCSDGITIFFFAFLADSIHLVPVCHLFIYANIILQPPFPPTSVRG
jgi:hypothetical protein